MIVLRSGGLLVRVDPRHGGEILDLVDLATGRQLLGRPPFASLPRLAGPLDEDAWTDRYRGGWQTVTPNAGNACVSEGERHGFHGTASNDPWTVVSETGATATLSWRGNGLEIMRSLALSGPTLAVETTWRGTRASASFVSVEHIVVGVELLVPDAIVRLPGGTAFELSEQDGPTTSPADRTDWPEVRLLGGSVEPGDVVSTAQTSGRFFTVVDVPEGWYEVENRRTGQWLRVEWDTDVLPHLWVWREIRASGGRWRGQAELLGLEPASVPHSLGLARAREAGQAFALRAGESRTSALRVTVGQNIVENP